MIEFFNPAIKSLPISIGWNDEDQANDHQHGQPQVIPFEKKSPLQAEHQRAGHSAECGNEHEKFDREVAQTEEKTEVVFRKARKNEQGKNEDHTLVPQECIETPECALWNETANEVIAQVTPDQEIGQRSQGQPDG